VLDTTVWLDLLLVGDPRCGPLAAALADGRAVALMDAPCRAEWRRVLTYPVLRLDAARRAALEARLDAIARLTGEPLRPRPWPALPRCADPDDQKLLELACAADAGALLTRDQALLALDNRTRRAGLFQIRLPEAWQPAVAAGEHGHDRFETATLRRF
jgi:predicted nucleic acid-binding protein